MTLVSLEEARFHLRAEPDYPAEQITLYLSAAEESAQDFLNRRVFADQVTLDAAVTDGSAGEAPMVVNYSIKAAILLITAHLHANRENTSPVKLEAIPMGAHSFLWPHRRGLGV